MNVGLFIGPDGQDVFIHFSQIEGDGFRSLQDNEAVRYQLVECDKGFQAHRVRRVEADEGSPVIAEE